MLTRPLSELLFEAVLLVVLSLVELVVPAAEVVPLASAATMPTVAASARLVRPAFSRAQVTASGS